MFGFLRGVPRTQRLARVSLAVKENNDRCHRLCVCAGKRGFATKDDEGGSMLDSGTTPTPNMSFKSRMFGRRRSLSPLERVSHLLPQESLSAEVLQLREDKSGQSKDRLKNADPDEPQGDTCPPYKPPENLEYVESVEVTRSSSSDFTSLEARQVSENTPSLDAKQATEETGILDPHVFLPGERPLSYGEVVLAERKKKRRTEFRKMFLLEEGGKLHSSWGVVPHSAIVEHPSGSLLHTSLHVPLLLRRPSLEEFALYMKRAPAISYPKDCAAMLLMMDVNGGDCILESGSGSGALSLFLSRAVGSKGRVLSIEVRDDHYRRANRNYKRWRTSWSMRRGEDWPDNVQFLQADLTTCASQLSGWGFNAISLDMVNPHLALPVVCPHLHTGSICAVYLANVTQIVDLLEGIRCSKLPLVCERIVEVRHCDWLVAPALQKDGNFKYRSAPREERPLEGEEEEEEEGEEEESNSERKGEAAGPVARPFGSVPYIARPHPEQGGHTAFLVKLRKIKKDFV